MGSSVILYEGLVPIYLGLLTGRQDGVEAGLDTDITLPYELRVTVRHTTQQLGTYRVSTTQATSALCWTGNMASHNTSHTWHRIS